jgi:CHAT domain-containing protein/Tfp pilus assembly protein PilF
MSSRLKTWFDFNKYSFFPPILIAFFLALEIFVIKTARADYNHSLLTKSIEQQAQQEPGGQKTKEAEVLEQGKPIEWELAAGQSHAYQITLAEGAYLSVVVEQRGIDVVVKVAGPDGKQILEGDSELRKQGEESVSLVAEVTGSYRLSIESAQRVAPTGRYEIEVTELRTAMEKDRRLHEARKLSVESLRLYYAGRYDEALPLVERAVKIRRDELGPEHLDVVQSLRILAIIYRAKGETAKAEPIQQLVLSVRERSLGPEHPLVVQTLHNLANLYDDRGRSAQAERLYQRGLAIGEKMLGPEHPMVATSLNSLGIIYRDKGDYVKAEQYFQRALAIREKMLEPGHPFIGTSLNNLAALYQSKGDYVKAEQLYRRALALQEKTQGPKHPDFATSLDNLGLLYGNKGDYGKAEPLYQRALAIREKALGPVHPRVAVSLNKLAILYRVKGDYAKAEQFHQRALAILEQKLGPAHRDVGECLGDLAYLYCAKGDYTKAKLLYQRALAIYEMTGGSDHPHAAQTLNDLSVLYAAKGEIAQAVAYQSRAIGISERNIIYNLRTGSERQKLAYLATLSAQASLTISLHVRYAPDDPTAAGMAATTILQRKGRTLDAMSSSLAALRQRFDPQDRALLDRLNDVTAQLAGLVLGGTRNMASAEHQEQIKALEEKKETLEAEISRRSAEFRANFQPITLAAIQAATPTDAVLIEFASYQPFNANAIASDKEYGAPRYVAYLLCREGEIKWQELGDAKTIDDSIAAFRAALSDPKRRDFKRLARAIDEKVMQPLRSLLGDAEQILVSPDGALNLIPFEALVDEQGRYLIERYSFNYLTSGRDLLRLQVERESKSDLLIVADPMFGQRDRLAKAGVGQRKPQARRRLRQSVTTSSDLSSIYFAPLMGAELEAREIKSLFPEAEVLLGEQATEASLKRAVAPRILHIATHGFFLEDRAVRIGGTRGLNLMREIGDIGGAIANVKIENPLLRSGLALAGANRRTGSDDDGILTALEATGLNLWGTQLVVLSACDTGVGVVRTGEGVYGLRRALVLAGSESQVMSLWPVRDYATQRLMKAFYAELKQGQGRGEALRNVKLTTMRRRGAEHPFYWAGFIQSGKWTELGDKR